MSEAAEPVFPESKHRLSAKAAAVVEKLRGNPEKLSTWKKVAKALNAIGERTARGNKFSSWLARSYAEHTNLAIDYSSKGTGWKRVSKEKGDTPAVPNVLHRRASAKPKTPSSAKIELMQKVFEIDVSDDDKLNLIRAIVRD